MVSLNLSEFSPINHRCQNSANRQLPAHGIPKKCDLLPLTAQFHSIDRYYITHRHRRITARNMPIRCTVTSIPTVLNKAFHV